MLNTKFTFVSYPNYLKISLRSGQYGLSHSLQGNWRSNSKFTFYTLSLLCSNERQYWENALFLSQGFDSNNLTKFWKLQISNWKMSLSKIKFSKAINFTAVNQKKWNQSKWIHNQLVCKFWIWPLIALEAVAEAILAWFQWNFQDTWLRC